MTGRVYFIGAGPGAVDLLTLRATRIIEQADLVIYADSLVHPDVAQLAKAEAEVLASSRRTLEETSALMLAATREGKTVARVQSGDPAIYGALHEQMVLLHQAGVEYEIVPGVSSALSAAALLGAELTVPDISQTIIMTRAEGRTGPLPEGEHLRDLARHRASLALFLSGTLLKTAVPDLIAGGYAPETPAALVYRATWEDEQIIRGRLDEMAKLGHAAGMTKQTLLMVGHALDPTLLDDPERRSHLYSPVYSHGRRIARASDAAKPIPIAVQPSTEITSRGMAIVAVTKHGLEIARKLGQVIPDAEVIEAGSSGDEPHTPIRALLERAWRSRRKIVLVLATGAAVRLIAPLLKDKRSDPAVVAVDDAGRYAISLVGAHRADGNELAQQVAGILGAQAISTTASDALGLPALERLAAEQGWVIENDGVAVTRLAAAIVNGEPFGLLSDPGIPDPDQWWTGPAEQVQASSHISHLTLADVPTALLITDMAIPRELQSNLDHWVVCRPRRLVLGVGCSTGASLEQIESLILETLATAGMSPAGVGELASIDTRAQEPGILALAEKFGWPIRTYSAAQLADVLVPNPSQVVRDAVGTGSVSEASALLASGAETLLVTKQKNTVATVAVARRP
jgi:precorrin-4 C11-methyltransferase